MKVNSGTILLAFFAVVSGLVGVHLYREANRPAPVVPQTVEVSEKPKAIPAMTVPMVSRNLTPGQTITKDDVALVRLTREQMDKLGLKKAFMSKADQIIGKTVKRELRRGSTFDTRDFYPQGQGPGIMHRLKPGLRAITVSMLPTNALLGFAGAGQSVDVLFHYGNHTKEAQNGKTLSAQNNYRNDTGVPQSLRGATSTLIQGVEILALNQQTLPIAETKDLPLESRVLVTLAVYPREAELLRMATDHGELSLTLRPSSDEKSVPTLTPRTVDELINVKQQVRSMEIFRGKQVTQLQFQNTSTIKRTLHDGSRDSDKRKKAPAGEDRDYRAAPQLHLDPEMAGHLEPTERKRPETQQPSVRTLSTPASWPGAR